MKRTNLLLSLVVIMMTGTAVKSLKILGLFPHPGVSHFHFFQPIMSGLADAGHDVTIVSHFPKNENVSKNYKDISLTKTHLLTNSVNLEVINKKISNPKQYTCVFICVYYCSRFQVDHFISIIKSSSSCINGALMRVNLHSVLQLCRVSWMQNRNMMLFYWNNLIMIV